MTGPGDEVGDDRDAVRKRESMLGWLEPLPEDVPDRNDRFRGCPDCERDPCRCEEYGI